MKRKSLFCLAFTFLLPWLSKAQERDTTFLTIGEVQITAKRPDVFAAGSRHTVIDSVFLRLNNAGNLADVLQSRGPVYIKSYGYNMLATPTFRGTTANHTAVLWNGFNINQPTLGLSDFSLLPVAAIQSLQLQHGSAGSNFGSGAIGGAVLLNSGNQVPVGFKLGMQQDFGSFGHRFAQVAGSYGWQKIGFDVRVFQSEAANNFPYLNTAAFGMPKESMENASFFMSGFTGNFFWNPNRKNKITFRQWFTTSDFEVQASMISAHNNAQNLNRNLRLSTEWQHESGLGTTTIRGAYFKDKLRYSSSLVAGSDAAVGTYQAQVEHRFITGEKLHLNAGGDAQYFVASVTEFGKPVTEKRASLFALFRYEWHKRLVFNLNWRQVFIQDTQPIPAPSAGFNVVFLNRESSRLNWKGAVNRGYRALTLNERFWPPGNASLKPEESWSYETGLAYNCTVKNLKVESEITGYRMLVSNWIQWTAAGLPVPENVKKVSASGLEYSSKIMLTQNNLLLSAGGNYAYSVSEQAAVYNQATEANLTGKQLIYVPYQTASAYSDLTYKTWQFTLNWQFTGGRFTDAENMAALEPYRLISVYGSKTFRRGKTDFQIIGRVNNLANTTYQNYEYYAMPGRNYTISFRFQLN